MVIPANFWLSHHTLSCVCDSLTSIENVRSLNHPIEIHSAFVSMEDRPQPEVLDHEKMDITSQPSAESRITENSASSSAANANAPAVVNSQDGGQQEVEAAATPSILKRIWGRLGINALVVMFMVKGALPPTIALSIYQRYAVAVNYLNLGYVMIVISILSVPVLPRGKYLMNLSISLVSFACCFFLFFLRQVRNLDRSLHFERLGCDRGCLEHVIILYQ